MPALHFLKKKYVCFHRRQGLLERMYARLTPERGHAFMNVVGRYTKFHAKS
jgi:hypothetical protein